VRLSEILVSTEPKAVKDASGNEQRVERTPEEIAAAEAKAKDILEQLKKGAKFEDLAMKYSDGPTASQGGDIGYYERGKLAEAYSMTFTMKPGTNTDVIHTQQGFLILKVTEHPSAGIPPFNEVEPQIQQAIYMERIQPALRAYLTKLREQAYIDIKSGYVDSGASSNESKPMITEVSQTTEKGKPLKKKKRFLLF
jgi:peptidyl-prolyl cis-trans isomerase SurA